MEYVATLHSSLETTLFNLRPLPLRIVATLHSSLETMENEDIGATAIESPHYIVLLKQR